MTKEALKLALEALETSMYPQQKQLQAITAIKEALAQRTWVGLTEQDRIEISDKLGLMDVAWLDLMEAIEAKLKEKNC